MNIPRHHLQTSGANGKEPACQSGDKGDVGLSLAWENPRKEGMATQFSILAWRIPMDRGASWATVHGVAKSWT